MMCNQRDSNDSTVEIKTWSEGNEEAAEPYGVRLKKLGIDTHTPV
jgi:hypothetical protein